MLWELDRCVERYYKWTKIFVYLDNTSITEMHGNKRHGYRLEIGDEYVKEFLYINDVRCFTYRLMFISSTSEMITSILYISNEYDEFNAAEYNMYGNLIKHISETEGTRLILNFHSNRRLASSAMYRYNMLIGTRVTYNENGVLQ